MHVHHKRSTQHLRKKKQQRTSPQAITALSMKCLRRHQRAAHHGPARPQPPTPHAQAQTHKHTTVPCRRCSIHPAVLPGCGRRSIAKAHATYTCGPCYCTRAVVIACALWHRNNKSNGKLLQPSRRVHTYTHHHHMRQRTPLAKQCTYVHRGLRAPHARIS